MWPWAYVFLAAACCVTARLFPRPGYINPWQIEYNLYFGSGKDIDISKMFLLPPLDELQEDVTDAGKNESAYEVIQEGKTIKFQDPSQMNLENAYDDFRNEMLFKDFDEDLQMEKQMLDEFPHRAENNVEKLKKVSNLIKDYRRKTRRYHTINWVSCFGSCYWAWYDNKDGPWSTLIMENRKRVMLVDLALAYLIHMRYKVREAMRVRHFVKNDKRYMLGYLFNRLRRLMYDIRKIYMANALIESSIQTRQIAKQVKVHRTFINLEVDIRDTVEQINHVYLMHIEPEFYEVPTRPPLKPKDDATKTNATTTTTTIGG